MTKCVSPISKFLLLTSLSISSMVAWAQTSSTTTSVPAVSATPAKASAGSSVAAVAPQKTLRQKLSEKLTLSYYNWTAGPGLDGNFSAAKGVNNEITQVEIFHSLRAGYRFNPNVDAGAVIRYDQNLASKTEDGKLVDAHDYQILNPRVYARLRNAVDNKLINMSLQGALEIPRTNTDKYDRKMLGAVLFTQNISLKIPNQKWSLSASFTEVLRHYEIDNPARNTSSLVIYPNLSYNFTPVWGLQTYLQYTRNHKMGSDSLKTVGDKTDYFRVGATYAPNDWLQLYIPIQMYSYDPKLQTASMGLEISAGL